MANGSLSRVKVALQMVSKSTGKVERMVDLGCGDGEITLMFKEKLGARRVYGVDIDKRAVQLARQKRI